MPQKQSYLPPKVIQKTKANELPNKQDLLLNDTTVNTSLSELSNEEDELSSYNSDDNNRYSINLNKLSQDNVNLNLKQSTVFRDLEDRAKDLIDKTEFLLTDKCVSSDGVGSSSSSSFKSITTNSNVSTLKSELAYKPEFVKYLELHQQKPNKLELGLACAGTNDDILTQWRLRRKFDEAKNSSLSQQYNQLMTKRMITENTPITPIHVSPVKHISHTISTQTNVDMAVQTSIENSKDTFKGKLIDEEPTRDENINIKKKLITKKPEKIVESNAQFTLKQNQPNYKSTPKASQEQSIISDLTKVSSILDNTRVPCVSNSNLLQKSTISNINSSMNSLIGDLNKKSQQHQVEEEMEEKLKSEDTCDELDYESDEILNMLFKKSFYYQEKLKQIDKLIAIAKQNA